ncbi:MAG: pilus assembly protein PilM [Candidatus Omnitrophica bacterium]|nr:pilus assembly protein PilM [Candidatus Omnitrophota bacterium]MDD5477067.1 pilus assembly protein PilM [Candidatus Omnitrophota bacterium]
MNIGRLKFLADNGKRDFVGIDFSSNTLKLVHARGLANKRKIVNIKSCDITGLPDAEISKVIRACFNNLTVKDANIVNTVASHLILTKNIEIPSIDHGVIKKIIDLQAPRHTPYSREEIISDYIDICTYKHTYTKILLVIVARNVIKRQFEILEKAGLKLTNVFLAPEGLARSISRILKIETENAPVGILHIDESCTDFSIVFKSKVLFIRSIPIGARSLLDEKEKFVVKFIEEIKRSLEAYQAEEIESYPKTLFLTGAIEELKDVETILNNNLHLSVKIVAYLSNLIIPDEPLKAAFKTRYSSFLNVIAPLFSLEEMRVSFIPEEIKIKRSLEERGNDLIKIGVFTLTIFILLFFILLSKIYFKSVYLKELSNKYQTLDQESQKLEKESLKVKTVRNYLSSRGFFLEALTELHNISPLDLELNDIRFDEQDKFSVRGTAESMSIVFSFVDSMKKLKYFQDVKTKYTTKRKDGYKDLTDFEITALLNKEAR